MRSISLLSIAFRIFIAVFSTGMAITTGTFYRMGRGDHLLLITIFWSVMAVLSALTAVVMILARRTQGTRTKAVKKNFVSTASISTREPCRHDFDDIDPPGDNKRRQSDWSFDDIHPYDSHLDIDPDD